MDADERIYTAAVIVIGNEVLSGRVRDANLSWLAVALKERGIRLREARVIADDPDAIVEAVNALRARHDYVFTTGGIGPTHDDITAACVARAFGVEVERNAEAERILEAYYGDDVNEARMRMADIPRGASLIDNPVSRAPGFRIGNVYVMAGVPRIMQAMFDGLKSTLAGGRPVRSRTVVGRVPESRAAAGLAAIQTAHPEVEIGSYPFFRGGRFGTALVVRGVDEAVLDAVTAEVAALVRSLGVEPEIVEGESAPPE